MIRWGFLLLWLICFSLFGCGLQLPGQSLEPTETVAGEVAFKLAGQGGAAIIVPVKVNGKGPYNFVLDTGATITLIDERLAQQLKLPQQPGTIGIGQGIKGKGSIKILKSDLLQVGSSQVANITIGALDLQQISAAGLEIDGLLGLNFLKSFQVTIDFQRKVLKLASQKESLSHNRSIDKNDILQEFKINR